MYFKAQICTFSLKNDKKGLIFAKKIDRFLHSYQRFWSKHVDCHLKTNANVCFLQKMLKINTK
jgi:hypothetical protein